MDTDIPMLWTLQDWLYLAVVLELCLHKIVGWAMSDRLKTPVDEEPASMVYWHREPEKGIIHHSDRGTQYTGNKYQGL